MADEKDRLTADDEDLDDTEDSDVYVLDVDDTTVDVEDLAREALDAVERRESGEVELSSTTEEDALRTEVEELRDRSIRTLADFENYRKRAERERADLVKYGVGEVLQELLPIVDNLERALEAGGSIEDLKTGLELIVRQIQDLLRQRGVEAVEAVGRPFDPTVHEAVMREEDPEATEPTVTAELQRGYVLHDRLLRPAMVRVAMSADPEEVDS